MTKSDRESALHEALEVEVSRARRTTQRIVALTWYQAQVEVRSAPSGVSSLADMIDKVRETQMRLRRSLA